MERPLSPFMFPTWYRFQIDLRAIDPASAHGDSAVGRLDSAHLVAHRRGSGRTTVRGDSCIH